jgi:hypothetical protein
VGTLLQTPLLTSILSATTDGHGPKALCVPPEILKNAPAFVREGESYFRTVGASSTVWGNLVVNWVRLELSCKIQGVSHNGFF